MFFTRKLILMATVSGAAVATSGMAVASGTTVSPPVAGPPTPGLTIGLPNVIDPSPDPVAAVEPAAAKAFTAFTDQPATPMPADVAAQVGSPTLYGRNPKLARKIDTVNGPGWLIPGRGFVCIAVPDPVDGWGTTCQPTDSAATQGLWLTMGGTDPKGRVEVTMIAPRGTRTVVAKAGATTSTTLTATNGVSSAVVDPTTAVGLAAK